MPSGGDQRDMQRIPGIARQFVAAPQRDQLAAAALHLLAQAAELNGIHRAVPDRHRTGQLGGNS